MTGVFHTLGVSPPRREAGLVQDNVAVIRRKACVHCKLVNPILHVSLRVRERDVPDVRVVIASQLAPLARSPLSIRPTGRGSFRTHR